jgi:hypothetical protein
VGDPGARILAIVGTAPFNQTPLGHNASSEEQLHVAMVTVVTQAPPAPGAHPQHGVGAE